MTQTPPEPVVLCALPAPPEPPSTADENDDQGDDPTPLD